MRKSLCAMLAAAACGPGTVTTDASSPELEAAAFAPEALTVDDSDLDDFSVVNFRRTYGTESNYFNAVGSPSCSDMNANTALALITIARQVHHDAVNVIDPSGVYQTGPDKRLYIADMGGCPETDPESPGYDPYAYHHDDGGNFHRGTTVADFLYYTREETNCTQSNCGGLGNVGLYDSSRNLIEGKVDWLRIGLFVRYLNQIFPQANIMMGTQLEAYVAEQLRSSDPALRALLEELAIYRYVPKVQGDDNYNHPYHMHVGFSSVLNWDGFDADYWYFNSDAERSFEVYEAQSLRREGNHAILFPIANRAGAFAAMPRRCDGGFAINTRAAFWESECVTGWEELTLEECGTYGLDCPLGGGATTSGSFTCSGHICSGIGSALDHIRRPDGVSNRDGLAPTEWQRYCCAGSYQVDATLLGDPSAWETACSTGWQKVGVLGQPQITPFGVIVEFQECSSAGVEPPPPSVMSCVDALCSGSNAVVFPVVNGEGRANPYPATCRGGFSIDVRGGSLTSSCSTAWDVASDCGRPDGGEFANCPYQTPDPDPDPEPDPGPGPECTFGADCAPSQICDQGVCVLVEPMCVTDGDCAPGAACVDAVCVASECTGAGCGTPPPPSVDECIDARCAGANAVVFPVVNGDGRANPYPETCAGEYTIDVRGSSWSRSCATGWVAASSCDRPDGGTFADCPYPEPVPIPPPPSVASCVDDLCSGTNAVIYPVVNGDNRHDTYPMTCVGNYVIDVRDSSWSRSCSTDWVVASSCERPDGGSFANCPYPEPEPPPSVELPDVRSCINALCYGADDVVFPVKNGANMSNRYPATCRGSYTIDVRGSSWTSSCNTGWEVASSCARPGGGTFSNCPYPSTNSFNRVSCVDNYCRGKNSDVHPVANATGKSNGDLIATCTGSWWIDTRGSGWDSHCSSGWTTR